MSGLLLLRADGRKIPLLDASVNCVVTSPPYWGLRDYGVPGQLGLEPTPALYVEHMVEVFREVWRVLRPDGTLWLNLGDCYAGSWSGSSMRPEGGSQRSGGPGFQDLGAGYPARAGNIPDGLKPKDLVGIHWRCAFALQADGWWLRSDIVWSKPNPMPESVTDRPTRSHEYVFLLSKSERYAYDADVIREPSGAFHAGGRNNALDKPHTPDPKNKIDEYAGKHSASDPQAAGRRLLHNTYAARKAGGDHDSPFGPGRNARSVWTIATQPYSGAHFATFPEELVRRCLLAGCPKNGIVLDPFAGSGTVGKVAIEHGRRAVLCDLAYHDQAKARTSGVQRPLAEATL